MSSHLFSRPFPAMTSPGLRLRTALLTGLFIFLFLYVFQPFGLAEVNGNLLYITIGYGIITFLGMSIAQFMFPTIFPAHYDEDRWTTGKEIFQAMLNILLIAAGNFFYSAALGFFSLSWNSLLLFIGFTAAIGIIPSTAQVLIRENIYFRKNRERSDEIDTWVHSHPSSESIHKSITLQSENSEENLTFDEDKIVAIESADNYALIHTSPSEKKSTLIRNSLSRIEESLPENFFRTHRSWIVNLKKVESVSGNARGYSLIVTDVKDTIPVARRRIDEFDQKMKSVRSVNQAKS